MNKKYFGKLAAIVMGVALASLASCGSQHQAPHLDVADSESSDEEWRNEVQMIRVMNEAKEISEISGADFYDIVEDACEAIYQTSQSDCDFWVVKPFEARLCMAKIFFAAAQTQATPLRLESVGSGTVTLVPEQTEDAAAYLSELAIGRARDIMHLTANGGYTYCSLEWDADLNGRSHLGTITSIYADAFHTARDAYDRAIEATLNSSDALISRNSTSPGSLGIAISGARGSRAAAAHLLVGGDAGLDGSRTEPLCSSEPLTPQGRTALQLLRDAGVAPNDVLDESLSTASLLNGTLDNKSVRERLGQYYGHPALVNNAQSVESFYDLSPASFEDARNYLAEEILAFSRSRYARLPAQPGMADEWRRYAGTATEPSELPAMAWLVRARQMASQPNFIDLNAPPYEQGLQQLVARGVAEARRMLNTADFFPAPSSGSSHTLAEALAPLAMISSSAEYDGYAIFNFQEVGPYYHSVFGYGPSARLRIVVGEDGLRCAVEGSIEGADCSNPAGLSGAQYPCAAGTEPSLACLTSSTLNAGSETSISETQGTTGFSTSTGLESGLSAKDTYYLVRPKSSSSPEAPGHFEVLAGSKGFGARGVPIVKGMDQRVAAALAPSRSRCAVPSVSCAGVSYDARLPLEDELSTDSDGVENSWRHYLALARQAADEADELGKEYVESALDVTIETSQVELRREEQIQRAEEALQAVQSACGTAIESRRLLSLLTTGELKRDETGSSCSTDSECTGGMRCEQFQCVTPTHLGMAVENPLASCTTDAECGESYTCVVGRCLADLTALAGEYADEEPELQRLSRCLGTGSDAFIDFLTLGDRSLCVYVGSDSGDICPEGSPDPCPYPVPAAANPSDPHDTTYVAGCPAPSLQGITVKPVRRLDYFKFAEQSKQPLSACDHFRKLRTNHGNSQAYEDLVASGVLHPMTLGVESNQAVYWLSKEIGWLPYYGGYSGVWVNERELLTTGRFHDPVSTSGLCAAEPPEWCDNAGSALPTLMGLFCATVDCGDPQARARMNRRLFEAVIAANLIRENWGYADSGVERDLYFPFAYPTYSASTECGTVTSGLRESHVSELEYPFYQTGETIRVCQNATNRHDPLSSTGPSTEPWIQFVDTTTPRLGSPWNTIAAGGQHYWVWGAGDLGIDFVKAGSVTGQPNNPGDPMKIETDAWPTRTASETFLRGFYPGSEPDADISWTYRALMQSEMFPLPVNVKYRMPEGSMVAGGELTPDSYLDGIELLCEKAVNASRRSQRRPEQYTTLDDLYQAGAHLQSIVPELESNAARMVFADMPQLAVDVFEQGGRTGAFPAVGGAMAEELTALREALISLMEIVPIIGSSIAQIAAEMDALHGILAVGDLQLQVNNLQLMSTTADSIVECTDSLTIGNLASSLFTSALAHCANAAAQISIATSITALEVQIQDLNNQVARARSTDRMAQIAETLHLTIIRLNEIREKIDGRLAAIDNLRKQARINLSKAVYLASWQSEKQAEATRAAGTLASAKQVRYKKALENARKMTFVAKRAIEQRLGQQLSELKFDLPLVEAPARWEGRLCTMKGIDYSEISEGGAAGRNIYVEGFIGDYVTNLENLVESYRMAHSFHEGDDIAIISLRDDVLNVRKDCRVEGENRLRQAGQLDDFSVWYTFGCLDDPAQNCVTPIPLATDVASLESDLSSAQAYSLRFGDGQGCPAGASCGWQPGATLAQSVDLVEGRYRMTWYSEESEGSGGSSVNMLHVAPVDGLEPEFSEDFIPATREGDWNRVVVEFEVDKAGQYEVGFGTDASVMPSEQVTIAAPMLEKLPGTEQQFMLKPFQNTGADTLITLGVCEDTDGAVFRYSKWKRNCVRLCDGGFSNNCTDGPLHCYREASFGISQSWIETGEIFNYSGFARGNFNYRIDTIGLNFVGTGIRDCSDQQLKSACYSAGFVPYTLLHQGPFFVRNHFGDDFRAYLFDGRIEHARGLATERYISNPLSSDDRELLSDYMREELQGRPLDGNFVIRVWEEPGGNFDAIEDVQLVVNYRYWTRFE